MPHTIVDNSGNLETAVNAPAFRDLRHHAAVKTDAVPEVRVRAVNRYSIAGDNPKPGTTDAYPRLRRGRAPKVTIAAVQALIEAAQEFLVPCMTKHPPALSFAMRTIDRGLSPISGTKRDHLEVSP